MMREELKKSLATEMKLQKVCWNLHYLAREVNMSYKVHQIAHAAVLRCEMNWRIALKRVHFLRI